VGYWEWTLSTSIHDWYACSNLYGCFNLRFEHCNAFLRLFTFLHIQGLDLSCKVGYWEWTLSTSIHDWYACSNLYGCPDRGCLGSAGGECREGPGHGFSILAVFYGFPLVHNSSTLGTQQFTACYNIITWFRSIFCWRHRIQMVSHMYQIITLKMNR